MKLLRRPLTDEEVLEKNPEKQGLKLVPPASAPVPPVRF